MSNFKKPLKIVGALAAVGTGVLVAALTSPPRPLVEMFPAGAIAFVEMDEPGQTLDRIAASKSASRVRGRQDLQRLMDFIEHYIPIRSLHKNQLSELAGEAGALAVYPGGHVVMLSRPTALVRALALAKVVTRGSAHHALRLRETYLGVDLYTLGDHHAAHQLYIALDSGCFIVAMGRDLMHQAVAGVAGKADSRLVAEAEFQLPQDPGASSFARFWLRPSHMRNNLTASPVVAWFMSQVADSAFRGFGRFVDDRVVVVPAEQVVEYEPPDASDDAWLAELYASGRALAQVGEQARQDARFDGSWSDQLALLSQAEYARISLPDLKLVANSFFVTPNFIAAVGSQDVDGVHELNRRLVFMGVEAMFHIPAPGADFPNSIDADGTRTYRLLNTFTPSSILRSGVSYTSVFRDALDADLEIYGQPANSDLLLRVRPDLFWMKSRDHIGLSGFGWFAVIVDKLDLAFELEGDDLLHGGLTLVF